MPSSSGPLKHKRCQNSRGAGLAAATPIGSGRPPPPSGDGDSRWREIPNREFRKAGGAAGRPARTARTAPRSRSGGGHRERETPAARDRTEQDCTPAGGARRRGSPPCGGRKATAAGYAAEGRRALPARTARPAGFGGGGHPREPDPGGPGDPGRPGSDRAGLYPGRRRSPPRIPPVRGTESHGRGVCRGGSAGPAGPHGPPRWVRRWRAPERARPRPPGIGPSRTAPRPPGIGPTDRVRKREIPGWRLSHAAPPRLRPRGRAFGLVRRSETESHGRPEPPSPLPRGVGGRARGGLPPDPEPHWQYDASTGGRYRPPTSPLTRPGRAERGETGTRPPGCPRRTRWAARPPGVVRRFGEPEPRRWPATGGPLRPSRSGGPVPRWFATHGPPDCSDGRSEPARGRRRAAAGGRPPPRAPAPPDRRCGKTDTGVRRRVRSPPATRPPGCAPEPPPRPRGGYLVDPASSYMLVSKIKPCMSKYKLSEAKLQMAH